jgi:O-succinylbenzoate synthase
VRIAVDENVRLDADISLAQIRQAADVLVIKAIPFGGVRAALDFVDRLELPTVVSGSLDTYVGLSAGLALAGALPELAGSCGLGTGALFASEIVAEVPSIKNGELPVTRFAPDSQLLARAGNGEQTRYWQERIIGAWEAGAKEMVSPEVREAVESF